jgi:hypothetical protein
LREGMWKPEGMEGAGGEANESKNGTAWDWRVCPSLASCICSLVLVQAALNDSQTVFEPAH